MSMFGTIVVVEVVDRLLSVAFLAITMRTFTMDMDRMTSTVLVVDDAAVNTPSMLILKITVAAQHMSMSAMVRFMLLSVPNDTLAVFAVSRAEVLGEERVTLVEPNRSLVVSNELALAETVRVLSIAMGTLAIAMSMLSFSEKMLALCEKMLAVRVVVRMLAVSVMMLSVAVMTLAVSRVKIMVVKGNVLVLTVAVGTLI